MKTSVAIRLLKVALLILLIGIIPASCSKNDESRKKILKIYNWADYIDEDLLKEFPAWYKEQTGEEVEIVYQVFDMAEVMYTKVALGKEDYDLVCPTQYIIERMLKQDMLLPIDRNYGDLPDYTTNLSSFLKNRMDAFSAPGKKANDYMLPYMWGTSGILYNPEFISKEEVSSWACFFNQKNKGKILMKDHYWDAYNMAAIWGFHEDIASGRRTLYNVSNDHTKEDFAMVEKQLKLLQPNLAGWEADFGKEMMTKGQAWMNYAWSGDAVWAIEEAAAVNVTLDYSIPKEGSNIWFDGWVIPKNAGNPKAASYFLNFISMPENALRNMDITGYTSALATPEILEAQIDSTLTETINLNYFFGPGNDSLKVDPIQYPDSAVVERCVLLHDFMDKNDEVLEMWSRAKGDSLNNRMIYIIVVVVAALIVGTVYSRFRKKSRKRK